MGNKRIITIIGSVAMMLTVTALTCSTSLTTSAIGYTAVSIEMSATVNGLAQGETATLLIGQETPDLEVQNALFEYPIIGTGESIQKDMVADLEDGYYLLLLEAPDNYFREPKGYSFSVHDSVIVNPTGKTITFDLKPMPPYPASEAVIDLSAPPKQPIPIQIPPTPASTEHNYFWQRWLVTAVMAIVVIALVVVLVLWRRRSRISHKT